MNLEQKTITSLEVAEMVEKEHKNILRDIRGYDLELSQLKIEPSEFFTKGAYKDSNNQSRPCYNVTKKGCEFIAHKLTGIKGTEFTAKYINRFHEMEEVIASGLEGLSVEMQALIMHDKKIQAVVDHIATHDKKIDKLENTMTIDYGQQQVLKKKVNGRVTYWLGGKESNAYKEISKKVFSECNGDIQDYFNVNSRNNVPKLKFDTVIDYITNWEPSTNTKMLIRDTNAQLSIA